MHPFVVTLMLVLATVLWGANFNLAKHVLTEVPALAAGAARFDIAALVMLAICLVRREHVPLLRHARVYAMLGGIGIAGFNILFFYGMQSTSAVNGALIMAANPLLTAIFAVVMTGARLRPLQWVALPIGLGGVAFVVLGAGAHFQIEGGDLVILGGSVCWGLYNVLVGQKLPRDVSALANTTGVMSMGALFLTIVALAAGTKFEVPGWDASLSLIAMALGGSVLSYLFWNAGIARLGASRAALFMNLVPVTSMVIAAIEGQAPTWAQAVGGLVVIGAVALSSWPGSPTARRSMSRPNLQESA